MVEVRSVLWHVQQDTSVKCKQLWGAVNTTYCMLFAAACKHARASESELAKEVSFKSLVSTISPAFLLLKDRLDASETLLVDVCLEHQWYIMLLTNTYLSQTWSGRVSVVRSFERIWEDGQQEWGMKWFSKELPGLQIHVKSVKRTPLGCRPSEQQTNSALVQMFFCSNDCWPTIHG